MISVIIPTFNEKKVIVDCLTSLLRQNVRDFEIIVVDDGSSDNTLEKIKQLSAPQIRVFTQNHLGPGAARNLGAKYAKGDILVFVDADMTFEKVFLRKLVAPMTSKGLIGTFSKEEYVSNWKNIWARCWNWNLNLPGKRRLPTRYPDQQKVFRAIRADKFKKAGGFVPGGYTDDWSISDKLGVLAQNAPGARFYHQNPSNLREVFIQSKWAAKRTYKYGALGVLVALLRASLPMTIFWGILKSVLHRDPRFIVFKFVYDLGSITGVVSYKLTGRGHK